MKKSTEETRKRVQSSSLAIAAKLEEFPLIKHLVEKLADRRYDIGYSRELVPAGWQAIETSSIEAYVSGDICLSADGDNINMPFTSSFLFTCTKRIGGEYYLAWSNSLS